MPLTYGMTAYVCSNVARYPLVLWQRICHCKLAYSWVLLLSGWSLQLVFKALVIILEYPPSFYQPLKVFLNISITSLKGTSENSGAYTMHVHGLAISLQAGGNSCFMGASVNSRYNFLYGCGGQITNMSYLSQEIVVCRSYTRYFCLVAVQVWGWLNQEA